MVTQVQLERHRRQLLQVEGMCARQINVILTSIRRMPPEQAAATLHRMVPAVVSRGGTAASFECARFYSEIRAAQVGGRYRPSAAPGARTAQVTSNIDWAVAGMLDGSGSDDVRSRLLRSVPRMALSAGRNTIIQNADRDSVAVRYARIPMGPDPCAFCVMQASRGFVFKSDSMNEWHDNCKCVLTPSFEESPRAEGYDPDVYYEKYQKGYKVAGGRRAGETAKDYTSRLMSAMRSENGLR